MAPPPLSLPLCILPPGSGSPRLVCYCEPENGGDWDRDDFNLYVTDAAELWSTCFSPDSLATLALTLSLAEHVCNLERRLAATEETAISPRKSTQPAGTQFLPELDHQRGSSGSGVRRRCPGESLVNPGFKSKKPAGGVDFDET
ncbi:similar to hypothetical protein MGC36831 (predicted), isoform CRA_g [Rattus norvegicus]|uniref:Uncharacterized protein RGD1306215_predicted n=1 Tax=Rattus norvegicus TaxID=10116 RepID=A6JT63_RAT|nr:similar to hypothetical protein MGC36831 (predicted), isoform CRA_g [Rattus norvegicus]